MASPPAQSLVLQSLLRSAARRSGMLDPAPRVAGLTAPAKALFAAGVSAARPLVFVVANDRDVEQFTADARFFVSATEGLSAADVEAAVLPFPSQEVDPYRGLLPHFDVATARARALHALVSARPRLIIASAAALLPILSPPERLRAMSVELTLGFEIAPQDLRALLASAGFTPEDPVDEHGEYLRTWGCRRLLPGGRRLSRPRGVHRGQHRVDPAVRSRDAAFRGDAGPRPRRAAA